ncbi:lysoplasmalogenase, partial [Pseudomonas sp. FW305-130]
HILPAGPLLVAWKGSAVALLAVWVARAAHTRAARWLAVVLGFAALGDVLLETSGMTIGGAAFLIAHLLATGLYWTNLRADQAGTG